MLIRIDFESIKSLEELTFPIPWRTPGVKACHRGESMHGGAWFHPPGVSGSTPRADARGSPWASSPGGSGRDAPEKLKEHESDPRGLREQFNSVYRARA